MALRPYRQAQGKAQAQQREVSRGKALHGKILLEGKKVNTLARSRSQAGRPMGTLPGGPPAHFTSSTGHWDRIPIR
jgi:hypothetical protein